MRRTHKQIWLIIVLLCLGGSSWAYSQEDLIDIMLRQNSDLTTKEYTVTKSMLAAKSARAERYPTIDGEVSATYIGNPKPPISVYSNDILGGIDWPPGMEPQTSGDPIELYEGQESTYYQFNLSVTQPIYTWGKISDSIDLHDRNVTIRQLDAQLLEEELTTRLVILLDTQSHLEEIEKALAEQLLLCKRLMTITEQNYANGFILKEEVLSTGMRVQEVVLATSRIASQQQMVLFDLQHLTGLPELQHAEINYTPDTQKMLTADTGKLDETENVVFSDEKTLFEMLNGSIAVRTIAAKIAGNSVYWKPDLALRIDLGYSGPRFPFIETDWCRKNDYSFNATIAVNAVIWDGGKKLVDISEKNLSVQQAIHDKQQARDRVLYTYRSAVNQLAILQQTAHYYEEKMQHDREIIAFRKQQFENGVGPETDLILARIDLYADQIVYQQTLITVGKEYYTIESLR